MYALIQLCQTLSEQQTMEREKGCFQASFNAEIGKFGSSTPTIASLSLAAAAVKRIILEGGI